MNCVYKYEFDERIDRKLIREQMESATCAARGVYGKARVKMDGTFLLSNHRVVIDVSDEVGALLASVFTECANEKIGEEFFVVERVPKHMGREDDES
ncbi:MAG: hypothetical protein CUN54_10480 [Phototrophicales bacterium]|nr:MAG: hypothetical protein CUN54_10480 [Phototrophicales bacterium]